MRQAELVDSESLERAKQETQATNDALAALKALRKQSGQQDSARDPTTAATSRKRVGGAAANPGKTSRTQRTAKFCADAFRPEAEHGPEQEPLACYAVAAWL